MSKQKGIPAVPTRLALMLLLVGLCSGSADAQPKPEFEDFATATGRCGQSELDQLKQFQNGFTFALSDTDILSNNGISPATVGAIPPLTSLSCHGKSRNRNLWLISRTEEPAFCGWVRPDTLLKSKSKRASGLKNVLLGGRVGEEGVCGDVAPLTVNEYCAAMKENGANVEACEDDRLRSSTIDAKFLVWNAALTAEERAVNPLKVTIYKTPDATQPYKSVDVFSVLRIFDIARKDKDKEIFFLVGASHRNMIGWVKEDSGTVWYTVLSTFFSPHGEKEIRSDEPRNSSAIALANRPDNILDMLNGPAEFARYPVVFDRRRPPKKAERGWSPYLEIAFIGRFCGPGMLCAENPGSVGAVVPIDITKSDVMFLIDATKSMKNYFGLVANAVQGVLTGADDSYVGSPDFQFGVAMYGDYLSRNAMGLDDPIQYKQPIVLQPLTNGDEFANLPNEPLFIFDPVGDLEEAPYAAIAKTVRETPWRGDIPRFLIHVADHGDRKPPPQELIDLLRRERIFYIPIAVRGDYHERANLGFVQQAQQILDRHVTQKGETIGLPKVFKTYATQNSPAMARTEYDAIAAGLRAGIKLKDEVKQNVMRALLNAPDVRKPGTETLLPPGYARLTKAAMELFGINPDEAAASAARGTIAAKGYVKTAPIGAPQDKWLYYAAVSPGDVSQLKASFDILCKTIVQSDATDRFVESLGKILSILTGDTLDDKSKLQNYFKDRDTIPLHSQTILGEGLIELGRELTNPSGASRVKALQKEACRTAVLMQRIDSRQRLPRPFEKKVIDGKLVPGDLDWDERNGIYTYKNAEQHNWIYVDPFDTRMVFMPLDYLPGPPETIR
jgi:hypothetical protein